jgi:hypothetical protein
MTKYFSVLIFCICTGHSAISVRAQQPAAPFLATSVQGVGHEVRAQIIEPLEQLWLVEADRQQVTVADGDGRVYFTAKPTGPIAFTVGGALGEHVVTLVSAKGVKTQLHFQVDAKTNVQDGGRYTDMFNLLFTSMQTDTGSVQWNGQRYRYFVPWGLDHCHTMKGLKYFYNFGDEFVDLMRAVQRDDGMIWSFVQYQPNVDYFLTRDAWSGYTKKIGNQHFVRQPTENHPEYIFVKTIYQWWKANGNDTWMKSNLTAAARALDYVRHDPARWSQRFQLLKRVYTIDSWDFQVDDEYTPDLGLTNTMIIDPNKSKFGVFFGDNTAYIIACRQLAEMFAHAGASAEANQFKQRADEIEKRLNDLSWNGKFYTHFIDEDPTVKRNLGVDEKSQLAQSNTYSLNWGIDHTKSKAIIESYLDLKKRLPVGSPGEWYAIYPPFERGFDIHGAKWQYMNGGVAGHAAGELARGAFEHGYENYGADILERLYDLGKKYNNKIYFSYTGSIPAPPPPPLFTPLDLSKAANMDTWIMPNSTGLTWMNAKREGDDFRSLPVGEQTFQAMRFRLVDPAANNRKAVVAVSRRNGFPVEQTIDVNQKAAAIYLLHTASKPSSEGVAGAVTIQYADGARQTNYMMMEKHLTYWWFSQLETERSGIAWYGSNAVSKGIGLSWCAIDNPHPEKTIAKIILQAAHDETIYTVFALSLSDQKHHIPVKGPSFGGPDNWAAATAMAAFVEGLVGVKDAPLSQAFTSPVVAPRWVETATKNIKATVRYAPSNGYVAYAYQHDRDTRTIQLHVTAGGQRIHGHVLMPAGLKPKSATVNGMAIPVTAKQIEASWYADFVLDGVQPRVVVIAY